MAEEATAVTPSAKAHVPVEKWEIDVIGKLILELYHNKTITRQNDWIISKNVMRQEYQKYIRGSEINREFLQKINAIHGSINIGTLLFRTGFLINTPRGCNFYRIKCITLFEYRNNLMKTYDDRCISGESNNNEVNSDRKELPTNKTLDVTYEVDENAPKHKLKFEGGTRIRHNREFQLSSTGCFICEENFETNEQYEEHVLYHGDDSDFQSLKNMNKSAKNVFELSYQVCAKSHYFCFTMQRIKEGEHPNKRDKYNGNSSSDDEVDSGSSSGEYDEYDYVERDYLPSKQYHRSMSNNNIHIDKIVIVQSRSMYYVKSGSYQHFGQNWTSEQFFLDSHLFTRFLEQPIVIVYHYETDERHRYIEQHHFMRELDFPTVSLCINPRRLPNKVLFKSKIFPLQYLPPKDFRNAVKQQRALEYALNNSNEFRDYYESGKQLSLYNIRETIRYLLYIEDIDTLHEYFQLTQQNVKFRQFGNEYSFKFDKSKNYEQVLAPYDDVVAISSGSDCLIDFKRQQNADPCEVLLKLDDANVDWKKKKSIYFGLIDRISNAGVTFVCHKNIDIDETYSIIFRPNRMNLRNEHRALELLDRLPAADIQRVLFPGNVMSIGLSIYLPDLVLNNEQISDNPEQLQAVKFIANGPRKEAPYIIHGPPGTGKTTTLVEAILQLYMRRSDTKILITAGSNSACDEIALRLCRVLTKLDETRAIVRIYSAANERRIENIDELLIEHSNMYAGQFYPAIDVLHEYRIVVCTLSVVGRLSQGKFGRDDYGKALFTHVVFDEVAATTEAEVLMALTSVLGEDTRIIMAGDHKQLSAVIKSHQAEELGLGKSIMERLLERDCYRLDAVGWYDPSVQTRLLQNHRSHPAIVQIYNDLFYDGRLKAMMQHSDHPHCSLWSRSVSNTFPIIFHSVFGQVMRDKSSVSVYNVQELRVVMDYVKDLMYFGINGLTITQQDIGIISPYKRQYMYIQDELNLRNWYGIETGSVETFQGREKSIIIVSFVRSFTPTLGFLNNMKRLNVTLSRAKSLLILIGNPKTLSLSSEFSTIIELCKANNTLVGRLYEDNELMEREQQAANNTDKQKKTFQNKNNKKRQQNINNNNKKHANEMDKNKNNNKNNNNQQQGHEVRHHNRRQPMKHTTKPNHQHNAPHRHRQQPDKDATDSSPTTSVASSVQELNIDDYFQTLPTLNGVTANFNGTPKKIKSNIAKEQTRKIVDENELIERAKKLQIYPKNVPQSKPQAQTQTNQQPRQTIAATSLKPTGSTASTSTTQRSLNTANLLPLKANNSATGPQPAATSTKPAASVASTTAKTIDPTPSIANVNRNNFGGYTTKTAAPPVPAPRSIYPTQSRPSAPVTSSNAINSNRYVNNPTHRAEEAPSAIIYSSNSINLMRSTTASSMSYGTTYSIGGAGTYDYQTSANNFKSIPAPSSIPPPRKEKKLCIIS